MGFHIFYTFIQACLFYLKNRDVLKDINKQVMDKPFCLIAFSPILWVENIFSRFSAWWFGKNNETEAFKANGVNKKM